MFHAEDLIVRGLLEKSGRYKSPVYRLKKGGQAPDGAGNNAPHPPF